MSKQRITVVINSHSLDDFTRCRARYNFSQLYQIEPIKEKTAYSKGTIVHSFLAAYYQSKLHKETFDLFDTMKTYIDDSNLDEDTKVLLNGRIPQYLSYYKNETWISRAVERVTPEDEQGSTGFSVILYEDDYVLFVYEGEPDLIVQPTFNSSELAVVDHKTESRRSDVFYFSNQFRGYCWATKTSKLIVNYFGLQSSGKKPEEWFRRQIINFSKGQLETWRNDTIRQCFQIAIAIKNNIFPRSWNCEGKYGVCEYINLCENAHLPGIVRDMIKRQYKEKERKRSW